MSVNVVGGMDLINVNLAVPLINPLMAQLDLALFGAFGLSGTLFDLQAQFDAALSLQAQLGAQLSIGGLYAALDAIANIQASIQAALSLGLPTISADISASISASAAISAALALKLGGIKACIDLALSVKLPLVNLLAALNVGPVFVLTFNGQTLSDSGTSISTRFQSNLEDAGTGAEIVASGPTAKNVDGIILVTESPEAWAGIKLMLAT